MTLAELLAAATPGPWETLIEAGDEWWFGYGNQARIRGAKQPKWSSLAVLGCDDEEENADARLIALAPDLARLALDMGEALRDTRRKVALLMIGAEAAHVIDGIDSLLARLDGIGDKDETT